MSDSDSVTLGARPVSGNDIGGCVAEHHRVIGVSGSLTS